ncbi:MAG: hypothetical protein AAB225_26505 [Acidobacteriota bacterium]
MLAALPRVADENVLVGFDTADDAGVYRARPNDGWKSTRGSHIM